MNEAEQAAADTQQIAEAVGRSHLDFPVVGIGASAGCVSALLGLFGAMPEQPGMAFVVVVHLSPEHESNIDSILGRVTPLPVLQVREAVPIEPNHVYVISPAQQLSMNDGHLTVEPLERPRGAHLAIDLFFRTLAQAQRERAYCVVLSGTGSDGSLGLARVKECGGVTLVQTPEDAEYPGMPNSAIATGAADFILPVAEIGQKLVLLWNNLQRIELPEPVAERVELAKPPSPQASEEAEQALAEVMHVLKSRTGHDFRHYKRSTVLRRIERRLQVNAVPTLPDYRDLLTGNPAEAGLLLQDLLISVTNFFRDHDAFAALDFELQKALFDAPEARIGLRAWVAGCATGEEAYSVAMLLSEKVERATRDVEVQIFASDIDEAAIAQARAGAYGENIVADVTPARLRQFFFKDQGKVRVRKELRERILFAVHNLLRDPPFSNLDLICCRNLLIYLDRDVQAQVLQVFHFALRPGGLLFLGMSESADLASDLFAVVDKKHRIYRADGARRAVRKDAPDMPMQPRAVLLPPPLRTSPPQARASLSDLHERLREKHVPPSVLIDKSYNVLHSTSPANAYLRFAPGQPTQNLVEVVRPELRVELRTALYQATRENKSVEARSVRLQVEGRSEWVTVSARPIEQQGAPLMLVLFDSADVTLGPEAVAEGEPDPMLALLEDELRRTREQLHGSLGESAASNEELRASNEELQAINEELRSTTEELETSKEELQSVNEELITVNQELKTKIEETAKTNDDLKNLIASTDIATVFVDRGMRIKRFTPRASQLFNLIASDVGRSLMDITHRLDYPELERDAQEAFETLRTIEREVKGEEESVWLARVLPYRTAQDVIGGAVLNFVEISAIRRAQAQLAAGEQNLQRVVESTQDYAIITTDTKGIVTSWNSGAERLFGMAREEALGQPIDIIYTREARDASLPKSDLRRARRFGRAEDKRWHVGEGGRGFFANSITTPLHERGEVIGYAKIVRDETDRQQAEAQLEVLLAKEQDAAAEMQRAIALKDEFLAVMSHELKHPLNLIHVNAELLARLPQVREVPAVKQAAEVIRRAVLGQAKIIDDLLDLSRLRTGKLTLNRERVEWSSLLDHVRDAIEGDVAARQLTLRVEVDPLASTIDADRVRAEQITWNLLSNALKFTPPGGTIALALAVDGDFARLTVTDSGRGIAPDFLSQVFDMFRQADRSRAREQGGMGIGLALVKQLAEAHGGRVAVASEGLGRGATFSVWLPLARAASRQQPRAESASTPPLAGLRLLVVDDSLDALESFALLLELDGADVTAVASGREALAAAQGAPFDLLLSDVAMPGMDGYELIASIRTSALTPKVAAIALTGFGREQDTRQAREAGFDAHLPKPVVLEDLLQTIRRLRIEPGP